MSSFFPSLDDLSFAYQSWQRFWNPSAPSPPTTPTAAQGQRLTQPYSQDSFAVIVNPRSRQGQYPNLFADVDRDTSGFNRFLLEQTEKTPEARALQFRRVAQRALAQPGRVVLMGVGGDRTISDVAGAWFDEFQRNRQPGMSSAEANAELWRRGAIAVYRVGSAADIARLINAPIAPHLDPGGLQRFMQTAVVVPWTVVRASGVSIDGRPIVTDRPIIHTVGSIASGAIFERAAELFASRNWSRAPLLPYALGLIQRGIGVGLRGAKVKIYINDELVMEGMVGEVLSSQNAQVARVGTIPKPGGTFTTLAIPNNVSNGVGALVEAPLRSAGLLAGIDTTQGEGLSVLEPNMQLRPAVGQRLRVCFENPETGQPMPVPWLMEGDAMPTRASQISMEVQDLQLPVLAAPGSIEVYTKSLEALRNGAYLLLDPPITSTPENPESNGGVYRRAHPTNQAPRPLDPQINEVYADALRSWPVAAAVRPPQVLSTGPVTVASTATYPTADLYALAPNVNPAHMPAVVAQAHGVTAPAEISQVATAPQTVYQMRDWAMSETGAEAIRQSPVAPSARATASAIGPGLAGGLIGGAAGHAVLTAVGVTHEESPNLHDGILMGLSHFATRFTEAVVRPVINQVSRLPYHLASVATETAGGISVSQITFQQYPNLTQAIRASLASTFRFSLSMLNPVSLGVGFATGLEEMGPALAVNRLTDSILLHTTSLSNDTRGNISTLAMLGTVITRAVLRKSIQASSKATRVIAGAFVFGYVLDHAYMGAQWFAYGSRAPAIRRRDHEITDPRLREDGFFSWHNLGYVLCPEATAGLMAN